MLVVCARCHRHVREEELECPFCSPRSRPAHTAVVIAIVGALLGCGDDAASTPPPSAPTVATPTSAPPAATPPSSIALPPVPVPVLVPTPVVPPPEAPPPVAVEAAPPEPPAARPDDPPARRRRAPTPDPVRERPIAAYGGSPSEDPF